jgi:hypothetical protein
VNHWHDLAACRGHGSVFFAGDAFAVAVAPRVSASCPVRQPCAVNALDLLDHGVAAVGDWAGIRLRGYGRGAAVNELRQVASSNL